MKRIALVLTLLTTGRPVAAADDPWLVVKGAEGPGKGKRVVLVSGDEEYRSEETLPQLAKVLAKRHGFDCTVLFAIDPKDGTINPNVNNNVPGLESLSQADLMVIFTRFRDLPDAQMQHVVDYVMAGKPIVGLRTATHAFDVKGKKKHAAYARTSKEWDGGFGRQVLGETWISHHGRHGSQSTRGAVAPAAANHPILRGIKTGDVWGPTDVYGVRLPLPAGSETLLLGQVLVGMKPDDKPAAGKVNDPMMPIAWTKPYQAPGGAQGRAFTTTMGASQDFESEGVRRLLVNACYWASGMEDKIAPDADVRLVGAFETLPFKFGGFKKGLKPSDHARE